MHTEIHYTGPDAEDQAMQDIKDWLGTDIYTKLTETFTTWQGPMEFKEFQFYCHVAGIQGYPVRVWYDHLFPPKPPSSP